MNKKSSLPELVKQTLNHIHANLTAETNRYGHVFAIDRLQFWKAMNASYGYRNAAIRLAVIEGRSLYRTLEFWEETARTSFLELLTPEQIRLPREYADICLRVLQGTPIEAELEVRYRLGAEMDALETEALSPECLIVPAVLCGGASMAGARYASENELDEMDLEKSQLVESGEINDLKMTDEASDYEGSHWCSLARADFLEPDKENRPIRLAFWNHWLVDAVDVCRCKEERKLITDRSILKGKW